MTRKRTDAEMLAPVPDDAWRLLKHESAAMDWATTIPVSAIPAHASTHKHGGSDEVATATPGANEIPKAGGTGKLAAGWVSEVLALADLSDVTAKTGSGTTVVMATSPTLVTPRMDGIYDPTTSNLSVFFLNAPSTVNQIGLKAEVTGVAPVVRAFSAVDANVNLELQSQGTGTVKANGVDVVTTTGTQTLTNKTLTLPTIADFTNAQHDHQDADDGGKLDHGLALNGLTDDDHTQYALLAGRTGGQILHGGIDASEDLTLRATAGSPVGHIVLDGKYKVSDSASNPVVAGEFRRNGADFKYHDGTAVRTILHSGSTIAGRLIGMQFLTSGTTYTPTAGTASAVLLGIAGGGGGGGAAQAAVQTAGAGGGGAGGWWLKRITGVTGTYTYAIGAAGAGGAAGNNNGTAGGDTTFVNGATTYTANGGSGGTGSAAGTVAGFVAAGAGGTVATNGDVNTGGEAGQYGLRLSSTASAGGTGGSGPFGGGGLAATTERAGFAATGFGAGGGGGNCLGTTQRAGGAGTQGIIIAYEFS